METINTHGGARAGAGRKKGNRTKKIGFRATVEEREAYSTLISEIKDKTNEDYIVIINKALELYKSKLKGDK